MPTVSPPHPGFSRQYLVAVDSDGCAFDVMNWKHLHAFIPEAVSVFDLQKYGSLYPEAAKRVNLFSDLRGLNRFPALYCSLVLAQQRLGHPLDVPDLEPFRDFLVSGSALSRDALAGWNRIHPAPILDMVIEWSDRTNARIAAESGPPRVFGAVREALAKAASFADVVVCSAAAKATLVHEWAAGGLDSFVTLVAGQENGSKAEQLGSAIQTGGFKPEKVLMIGDAPGDHQAAMAAGARFYPIVPGEEDHSWQRCRDAVLPAFREGCFSKALEHAYVERFYAHLPACEVQPPKRIPAEFP